MPMREELYPDDWEIISLAVRDAAGWTCQVCDAPCRRPDDSDTAGLPVLTVAHWDHQYLEPWTFLVAACAACHNRHDRFYRILNRRKRLRERQIEAGQLRLLA